MSASKEEVKMQRKKRFDGKQIILMGRMAFANLVRPVPDGHGRIKYSMLFFWKDDCKRNKPELDKLNALIAEHKAEFYPKHPNFIWPVKHFDTYVKQDGSPNASYLKGCYWINASANKDHPPAIFDSNKNRLTDDAELTDGRDCMVIFRPYNYDMKSKTGVALGLRGVRLMPGGESPFRDEVDPDELFNDSIDKDINEALKKNEAFDNVQF